MFLEAPKNNISPSILVSNGCSTVATMNTKAKEVVLHLPSLSTVQLSKNNREK